ncbi:MAG: hypothetical protein ABR517_01120 [Thermoanaerobaculia bacterium]
MDNTEPRRAMRHIPTPEELIRRVDVVLRKRATVALDVLDSDGISPEVRQRAEERVTAAALWLDRAGELAKARPSHSAAAPSVRIQLALDKLVENLRAIDRSTWGVCGPSNRFDQSRWEPLWQAVLAAGYSLDVALDTLVKFDAGIWWEVLDTSDREHLPIDLPIT